MRQAGRLATAGAVAFRRTTSIDRRCSPMHSISLKSTPFPSGHARSHADRARPHASLAKALTLLAMSLGYGVVQLDVTIVNTALDAIGTSVGGGVSELQWVVSAYTISFAACILTAGAL